MESIRRTRSVHAQASGRASGVSILTITADDVLADPLDAPWFDGETERSIRERAAEAAPVDALVLTPGCLEDIEALIALDDRGALMLPSLRPYLR